MTFLGVPQGHIPGNSALLTSSKLAKIYYEGFPFHVPDGQIMVCPYTLGSAFAIPVDRMQLYSKTNVRMIVKMDCLCLRSTNIEHAWLISPSSEYTLIVPNSTVLQRKRLALANFSSPPSKRFRPLSDQESREKPMSALNPRLLLLFLDLVLHKLDQVPLQIQSNPMAVLMHSRNMRYD